MRGSSSSARLKVLITTQPPINAFKAFMALGLLNGFTSWTKEMDSRLRGNDGIEERKC